MAESQVLELPSRDQAALTRGGGSVYFIGNATLLVRYGDITFITDPTFVHMHEEVSIGYGMHTTRLTNPAMEVDALPPLDFILLSHFHGDHFDQVAERELDRALPLVTTPQSAMLLNEREWGNSYPLHRWESIDLRKSGSSIRVTAMPGRHGPPVVDFALPDVMGSLVEFHREGTSRPFRMYITGDTLIFDDLKEIPERYPEIDVAFLHLGGTRVLGVLVTMDAEQGIEMLNIVQPKRAIPIHYDDYDAFKSPLSDFQDAVREAGLEQRVNYLERGQSFEFGAM